MLLYPTRSVCAVTINSCKGVALICVRSRTGPYRYVTRHLWYGVSDRFKLRHDPCVQRAHHVGRRGEAPVTTPSSKTIENQGAHAIEDAAVTLEGSHRTHFPEQPGRGAGIDERGTAGRKQAIQKQMRQHTKFLKAVLRACQAQMERNDGTQDEN